MMPTPQQINKLAWPIYARPLRDGSGQILTREFRWHGKFRDLNTMVVASPGFVWDGASIPRFGWTFVGSPFTGKYQHGALVHDILYQRHIATRSGKEVDISRKFADDLFKHIMLADGVHPNTARQLWSAVRIGGGRAWKT